MRLAPASSSDPRRVVVVGLAAVGVLAAGGFGWASTRLGEYSVMTMGHVVDGGGGSLLGTESGHSRSGHPGGSGAGTTGGSDAVAGGGGAAAPASGASGQGAVDVTTLGADPARPADVRVELVARRATVPVPGGRAVEGYTLNGTSPGPTIRARQGDLVEVTLVNESVADGATLHWHGVDVPNAADGVAGVTQDAVPVGGRFVSRFVARTPVPTGTTRTRCPTSRSSEGSSVRSSSRPRCHPPRPRPWTRWPCCTSTPVSTPSTVRRPTRA